LLARLRVSSCLRQIIVQRLHKAFRALLARADRATYVLQTNSRVLFRVLYSPVHT
jgi:hypothetical protein